ncbi:peptidylprolyl isomerase [Granulicella cerasi]|uniref:Peptidylprolyl isomerase n=1 Tax=Granulicella cerasi TaxID=741063 RepID=A0ABW1Z5M2_9BACT|nr:peptidylprolyl isomerase [Granulicella cerasi]
MTEKQMGVVKTGRVQVLRVTATAFLLSCAASALLAQQTGAASRYPVPGSQFPTAPQLHLPNIPAATPITPNGSVVEDVIARVNDRIITRTEYERAQQSLLQEAQQQNGSAADLEDRQRNMLRDMIDQQILLSKGKELGITGDAEALRQLDELRKQNHLDSMEALQKAAEQQGISFEDFKQSIKDRAVSQRVVQEEVGRSIRMTHGSEQTYYDAHKEEFRTPEQLHLSEILIPTADNATDAQVAEAQKKADAAAAQLKAGANFAELAKKVSGGPTASAGGDLGDFKRGTLGDVLEKATFDLPVGGYTAPIRTRQGFVILRVDSHQQSGIPPLKDVEQQVQEGIYMSALQPALRAYLTKARDEAYIDIKPGFVDTGSDRKESKPTFTAYVPPAPKKKVVEKQRIEQKKREEAAAALQASREKVREKEQAKAAEQARRAGNKDVAAPVKQKKIRREKVRYGQAPRNALPTGIAAAAVEENAPLSGQAPGVAMAPTQSSTIISSGTGGDMDNPLDQRPTTDKKSRFTDREREVEANRAVNKLKTANAHLAKQPKQATAQEKSDETYRAEALGLNGDTRKKKKKRKKGDPIERITERPAKQVEASKPVVVDPTVNPNLAAPVVKPAPKTNPSDQTTLPPASQGAPNSSPVGQPIPKVTSADPNAPATTPVPPQ